MKNLKSLILSNANEELDRNKTLSPITLKKLFIIYRGKTPKNWPRGNSYKKKASYLIRKNYSPIIKRWNYSFNRKTQDLAPLEKIKKRNSYIYKSIEESSRISEETLSLENSFKKCLYGKLGNYKLLEEVGGETVRLIREIQEGNERSLGKLIDKKKHFFISKIKYKIPWRDKESIVSKAIYDSSKKALFVGGFNEYVKIHIQSELKKYFSEMPKERFALFGSRLEQEFADLDTIKLFDKATYETLLEQSNHANKKRIFNFEELSIPKKTLNRFEKLILSEGKALTPYMEGFIEGIENPYPNGFSDEKIIELFEKRYPKVDKNIVRSYLEELLEKHKHYLEPEKHLYDDFEDERFKIFLKEKEELENKEKERIRKEKTNNKKYLRLVARTLEYVEGVISDINFMDEKDSEREADFRHAGKWLSSYFEGFEAMPLEFRKDALIAKIAGEEFLGRYCTRDFCLNQLDLDWLKNIGSPNQILENLYYEGIILQEKIANNLYRAISLNGSDEFSSSQVIVFNEHPLNLEANSNIKSSKSHRIIESFTFDNYTCKFLEKKVVEPLNIPSKVKVDQDLEEILFNLDGLKLDILKLVEEYEKNKVPLPPLIKQKEYNWDSGPWINFGRTKEGIIVSPEIFYIDGVNRFFSPVGEAESFFERRKEDLIRSYKEDREKDYYYTKRMLDRLSVQLPEFKDPNEPSPEELMSRYDELGGERIREIEDEIERARRKRNREDIIEILKEEGIDEEDLPF